MTRFLGYIAASLDARIADDTGSVDWLEPFNDPATDFGYKAFIASVGLIVMGRKTYDFAADQPEWPYEGKRVIVMTSRDLGELPDGVETRYPDYDDLRAELVGEDNLDVWIMGGGVTLRGALGAGMLDELRLFVMPVILGGGPAVFADGPPADATLTDMTTWPGGIAELCYKF